MKSDIKQPTVSMTKTSEKPTTIKMVTPAQLVVSPHGVLNKKAIVGGLVNAKKS